MAERRALSFSVLDEVMPEVDRLLEGHTTTGQWSLGQICNHLGTAMQYTVEGFPEQAPWLLRRTVGPVAKRQIFSSGAFPEGVNLPEKYLPRPGLDPRAEAEALRASLRYYLAHIGPLEGHPLFGSMSRDEWDRYHAIHCAHHLSFVWPEDRA
jgi:hypothetical protein